MKKVVSSIIIILIITITLFAGYQKESILVEKKEMKSRENGNFIIYNIEIYKKDNYNIPLSNVVFQMRDFNNTNKIILEPTDENGYVFYENKINYTYEEILELLAPSIREKVKNLKTKADIEVLGGYCNEYRCGAHFSMPIIIEEIKVPSGYVKEKYIIDAYMRLYADFEGEEIIYKDLQGTATSYFHLKWSEITDFDNFRDDMEEGKYDDKIIESCIPLRKDLENINNSEIQYSIADPIQNCALNLYNQKGTIDLKIQNFVNEKSNVITTANKTLKYQIKVENKGTASSTENTIVTEIPKGLTYVENSASHNGEYNKNNHEIMWRIDEINAEETVELTYEATVPKDADPNMKYIGKTSINSKEVSEDIKSEETVVTIMDNPKTSNFVNFVILLLAGITVSTTYFTTRKRIN